MLVSQPIVWFRELSILGTLFAGALFTMTSNPVWAATNAFMFWAILGTCMAMCDPHRDHERGRWLRGGVPSETEVPAVRVAA